MKNRLLRRGLIVLISVALGGCTFIFQAGRRSDTRKIEELSAQLDELASAKKSLEDRLNQEISDKQIKLQMMEKGLVITVVGDLLFDSGKAKIKPLAYPLLDKIAGVLKDEFPQFDIGIEGHTDNVPIQKSHWKSNWELSSARALSVLHYMEKEKGLPPERLSQRGYGEYQPVASNDTAAGRKLNRRVEIVILPRVTKVTKDKASSEAVLKEPAEDLK